MGNVQLRKKYSYFHFNCLFKLCKPVICHLSFEKKLGCVLFFFVRNFTLVWKDACCLCLQRLTYLLKNDLSSTKHHTSLFLGENPVSSMVNCTWMESAAGTETFASGCSSCFLLKHILNLGNVNLINLWSSKAAQEPLCFYSFRKKCHNTFLFNSIWNGI